MHSQLIFNYRNSFDATVKEKPWLTAIRLPFVLTGLERLIQGLVSFSDRVGDFLEFVFIKLQLGLVEVDVLH